MIRGPWIERENQEYCEYHPHTNGSFSTPVSPDASTSGKVQVYQPCTISVLALLMDTLYNTPESHFVTKKYLLLVQVLSSEVISLP